MNAAERSPRVRRWIWDRGHATEVPGVMIQSVGGAVFIADRHLRAVADALHDRADEREADQ